MLIRVQELLAWLNDEYREIAVAYRDGFDGESDYLSLYRNAVEVLGSTINELEEMIGEEADEDAEYEHDGQPDDWQENTDFAHDDDFHNQECGEDGFWY